MARKISEVTCQAPSSQFIHKPSTSFPQLKRLPSSPSDGKFWINNDQVNKLLKGDGYEKTKTPQSGDVAIFKANGEVIHSTTVAGVDDKGQVTEVTGLGGTEPKSHSDTPEQVQKQFSDLLGTKVTVEYYHDPKPDRPVKEKIDEVKKYEKPED